MQICRQIRQVNQAVPIVMLTARDSESDQVIGLEIGADDYVAKPFSAVTIMARIKALYVVHKDHQLQVAGHCQRSM